MLDAGRKSPVSCAEATAAKAQPALAAGRTEARIGTVALVGKQPRREKIIERGGDLRRLLFHHFGGLRLEITPEFREHGLPTEPPARNVVELLLEIGRKVVGDVALEKTLEAFCGLGFEERFRGLSAGHREGGRRIVRRMRVGVVDPQEEALVRIESPSTDKAAVDRCGAELGRREVAYRGVWARIIKDSGYQPQ